MLVVGRIISGLSVGIASAIVPVYQSEITEPRIRGRLVAMQQWSITWGILLQYFVEVLGTDIKGCQLRQRRRRSKTTVFYVLNFVVRNQMLGNSCNC